MSNVAAIVAALITAVAALITAVTGLLGMVIVARRTSPRERDDAARKGVTALAANPAISTAEAIAAAHIEPEEAP